MRIIRAVDYGDRTVLWVCHNPQEPRWVHREGDVVKDVNNLAVLMDDGRESLIGATTEHVGSDGSTCYQCRNNWDVTQVILEGPDLYHSGSGAELVRLNGDELAEVAFIRAAKPSTPSVLIGLEGRDG